MNEAFHNLILEPLQQPFFQRGLLGGSLVAKVCGVVGCFGRIFCGIVSVILSGFLTASGGRQPHQACSTE